MWLQTWLYPRVSPVSSEHCASPFLFLLQTLLSFLLAGSLQVEPKGIISSFVRNIALTGSLPRKRSGPAGIFCTSAMSDPLSLSGLAYIASPYLNPPLCTGERVYSGQIWVSDRLLVVNSTQILASKNGEWWAPRKMPADGHPRKVRNGSNWQQITNSKHAIHLKQD